jgi:hypothetical protein
VPPYASNDVTVPHRPKAADLVHAFVQDGHDANLTGKVRQ